MKVDRRDVSIALSPPLRTADGALDRRDGVLLRVATDDAVGYGEAAPLAGWTESPPECDAALDRAIASLERDDPHAAREATADAPAAHHAVDVALADLDARRDETPLYRDLGADGTVASVPANAVVGDGSPETTAEAASRAVAAGFGCVKVKVGARSLAADRDRLQAVRAAVGDGIALRADANAAWDRERVAAALDTLADAAVDYVEQPLPATDLEGLAALRGGPVDVAVDESVAAAGPDAVLDADAADVLVVKPMVLGGVRPARTVVERAAAAGCRAVVTGTVDSVVARTAAVHLAASLNDPEPAGLATADRLATDLAPDPAPLEDGRLRVPQAPGLGVAVEGWEP